MEPCLNVSKATHHLGSRYEYTQTQADKMTWSSPSAAVLFPKFFSSVTETADHAENRNSSIVVFRLQ